MKQKVKPIRKAMPDKKPTRFAIDMDVKGIGFLLLLGLGTALIVFYLGYTYGKATRDPNSIAMQSSESSQARENALENEVQKNLKIYDVREENASKIEELRRSSKETLNDANRIIAETRQSQEQREAVRSAPAKPKRAETKEGAFKPQWPENARETKSDGPLYTYQIMSTTNIEKATSRVKLLKQRGFDAYRVAAKINGKLFYRVRVGRGTKDELKAIEDRLTRTIAGDGKLLLMHYGQ